MIEYKHLLGVPFQYGRRDCLHLLRSFYSDNFGISISDYARPEGWWLSGLDLYRDYASREGFQFVHDQMKEGDAILMAIKSEVANHVGIYVGGTKFIHHFYGQLSKEDMYGGMWRNRTVAIARHPQAKIENKEDTMDLMELLPARVKRRINGES